MSTSYERIGLIAVFDIEDWDRAVGRYLDDVDRLQQRSNSLVTSIGAEYAKLGGVIVAGMAAATAAVASGLTVAAKEFFDWTKTGVQRNMEFQQSMANIGAVLRKTREEVAPLGDLIDKLALDPQLVVSTDEAAAAVERLSRNGIEMTDILNGAAEATVLLANATGGDFSTASDVATMAMQQFHLAASDLSKVADISQGAVNNSRMSLEDWRLALGNGGAAASEFNVSLEDFATSVTGTINLFRSARQAGTSFTNFLERLVPLTTPAVEEMQKLGLFTGQTTDEYDKTAEKIKKLEEELANLKPDNEAFAEDTQKLTAKLSDQRHKFSELGEDIGRTEQAIRDLDPASKTYAQDLDRLNEKLSDQQYAHQQLQGDIQATDQSLSSLSPTSAEYTQKTQELNDQLAILRTQMVAGSNAFFDANGNLKDMSEVTQILMDATKDLSDEEKIEAFRRIFGNDALATAIGLSGMGAEAFDKLQSKIVVYGSAAEAAAARTDTLAARWENLRDIWDAIQRKSGAQLEGTLRRIVEWLTQLTGANQERIIDFFAKLGDLVDRLVQKMQPWVERMLPLAIDNLEALGYWFLEFLDSGNAWNDWLDRMSPGFQSFVEAIINSVTWVKNFVQAIADTIETIHKITQPLIDFIRQHVTLADVLHAAEGAVIAFLIPMGLAIVKLAAVGAAATAVIAYFRDFKDNTKSLIEEAIVILNTKLGDLIPALNNTQQPLINWIAKNVEVKDAVLGVIGALAILNAETIVKTIASIASMVASMGVFGLALVGIAAGVAALRIAWVNDWGGIQEKTQSAMKFIGEVVRVGVLIVGDTVDLFLALVHRDWASAWASLVDIVKLASYQMTYFLVAGLGIMEDYLKHGGGFQVLEWFGNTFPDVVFGLRELFSTVVKEIAKLWATLVDFFMSSQISWGEVFGFIEVGIGSLLLFISGLVSAIGGLLRLVFDSIQGIGMGLQFISHGWQAVFAAIRGDPAELQKQVDLQKKALDEMVRNFGEAGGDISDAFSGFVWSGIQAGERIADAIKGETKGLGTDLAVDITSGVTDARASMQANLDRMFADMDAEVSRNRFGSTAQKMGDLFSGNLELSFGDAGKAALGALQTGWDTLMPDWAKNTLDDLYGAGKEGGEALNRGLEEGMTGNAANVEKVVQHIRDNLSYALNLDQVFSTMGVHSMEELRAGLASGEDTTTQQVTDFVNDVALVAYGLSNGFLTAGNDSVQNYITALAQQQGIGEEQARTFSQAIISAFQGENQNFVTVGTDSMRFLEKGVQDNLFLPLVTYQKVATDSQAAVDALTPGMETTGKESVTALGTGATAETPNTVGVFAAMRDDAFHTSAQLYAMMYEVGQGAMAWLKQGLTEKHQLVLDDLAALRAVAYTQMGAFLEAMRDRGEAAISELVAGMMSQQSKVTDFFSQLGANISTSFASGISSQLGAAQTAAQQLVEVAATATAAAAQIASPSKRFAKLGEQSGEGYSMGWLNKLGELSDRISSRIGDFSLQLGNFGGMDLQAVGATAAASAQGRISQVVPSAASQSSSYVSNSRSVQIGPVYVQNVMDAAEFDFRVRQIIREERF